MQPKFYDMTKQKPRASDLCADMDEDCPDVPCKLACWLHAPELGICPYLSEKGESHDNRRK